MSEVTIDVSGTAGGSGTSVNVYMTPDYEFPWQGARVGHGSFTAGPTTANDRRIEIVTLHLPGMDLRVKASDVRLELRALHAAIKACREADHSPDTLSTCNLAFETLRSAVLSLAGKFITVAHLEAVVRAAFASGVRQGKELLQDQLCLLLGAQR
jgi:hypothetical protein